jgi:RNA polymerase sigma-70 factor (ECF subfamily)
VGADIIMPHPFDSTAELLERARAGDRLAREQVAARYIAVLQRFARGRLPRRARDLYDTDDLVQETVLRAFQRLDGFRPRREGAFLAYLREILLNHLRDQIRRVDARPPVVPLDGDAMQRDRDRDPLDQVLDQETLRIYERALRKLSDVQREAVVLRVDLSFNYREIAAALQRPSAAAARMLVARALVRLVKMMRVLREREQ